MKKTILIITTVLLFTGCSFSQSQSNIHYTFGVIETSSARKYTVIKYYNDDGKKVASTKLDEAQVGTSFNTTSYHDGYAYINNIGLQGHKNPQNIIQIRSF
ncbi:membrane lipoprotein lipid attachment site-containing protein [uncultured Catenibacterium sp.]|uniref:membrane lipoprotein lipid attachment site-containing protein n=1 Tax=uncultured Catenibacterium sp. TaxID=286142 RepID=UPI0025919F28|nr:membrane lipoprotein lipid attachment site-containing protein [uncultured Catenibacterium sp.]